MIREYRFLILSFILLVLNQLILHTSSAPSPQLTHTPELRPTFDRSNSTDLHAEYVRSIETSFCDSNGRLIDLANKTAVDDMWMSDPAKVHSKNKVNNSKNEANESENKNLQEEMSDAKDEDLIDDLTDDSIDEIKDDSVGDLIRNSTLDRYGIPQNDSPEVDDEHSEIEITTLASIFDDLNFTLPSLTRMIEMSEQGELDILNKTQPRRLTIDTKANEEIIGINDINRLIDNDLNSEVRHDYMDSDVLEPGEDCGRNLLDNDSPLTERIIGGKDTFLGEIPWIVSIRLKHPNLGQVGHWCASVLIDLQWVATASHCIINPLFHLPDPKHWEVRLGKHNISKTESTQKTYQVAKLFYVEQYRGYDNDLALLKLKIKVETNDYIRPICLPLHENFDFSNAECQVVGWDRKGAGVLQKAKVNLYHNIGNKFGGIGTCHGDSGGPMQCSVRNRWYLAGVTSFGSNCAKFGFPDVFTKITYFLGWIKEKIKNE